MRSHSTKIGIRRHFTIQFNRSHPLTVDSSTLHSPIQPVPPPPVYKEDDSEPIGQARQLAVSVPTASLGRADCFIDDILKVMLDRPDNVACQAAATLLAVFACTRPHTSPSEQVPRRENLTPQAFTTGHRPTKRRRLTIMWLIL